MDKLLGPQSAAKSNLNTAFSSEFCEIRINSRKPPFIHSLISIKKKRRRLLNSSNWLGADPILGLTLWPHVIDSGRDGCDNARHLPGGGNSLGLQPLRGTAP